MARLHCESEVTPQYVEEAYRLLRKSIIHVETADVTFEEDEEGDGDGDKDGGGDAVVVDGEEARAQHPGEYDPEMSVGDAPTDAATATAPIEDKDEEAVDGGAV